MLRRVKQFIDDAGKLKVLIVGETIIDEFVYVSYEGQSMKSICPAFKLEGKIMRQQGGASAIANHLRDFVKRVDVITNENAEIVKTRYVDLGDNKKHVEINKFDSSGFGEIKVKSSDYDVVIVADFGHGFCEKIKITDGFHLMCQTNSNNFGFNRISKWKRYRKKSVCIDLREASLQMNKRIRFKSDSEVMELFNYEMNSECLFLTLGSAGSVYADGKRTIKQKTFKSQIVDTIGAGDTFFAFASLSAALRRKPGEDIMEVPALAASLSTTWLCNERSVNKKTLLEHAARFI